MAYKARRDEADFTLNLCNLRVDGPWSTQMLAAIRDHNYRGDRMSSGYYLTDHFGDPAYMISQGTTHWIYAEDFEPILWPYAIKHLLTMYSLEHNLLHLKAAAVAHNGRGALLVGRGRSGKTVLLSRLCQSGFEFVSNTHVLIDDRTILGIPTTMRVRRDKFFTPLIERAGLSPSVKTGEYTVDPFADLGWEGAGSASLDTILLLDFKGPCKKSIQQIERQVLFDYMEHFSLAINVYGLKEDIFEKLGTDPIRFSNEASRMRTAMHALIEEADCYYVSCDAAVDGNVESVRRLLKDPDI